MITIIVAIAMAIVPLAATSGSRVTWREMMFADSQAWIWGPSDTLPDTDSHVLDDMFPDHGFVELVLEKGFLVVHMLREPPRGRWPPDTPFCPSVLPAAVERLITDQSIDLRGILGLKINLAETGSRTADCECVMSVAGTMEYRVVHKAATGSLVKIPPSAIKAFCMTAPDSLAVRRERIFNARLPRVADTHRAHLATANFVVSSFS